MQSTQSLCKHNPTTFKVLNQASGQMNHTVAEFVSYSSGSHKIQLRIKKIQRSKDLKRFTAVIASAANNQHTESYTVIRCSCCLCRSHSMSSQVPPPPKRPPEGPGPIFFFGWGVISSLPAARAEPRGMKRSDINHSPICSVCDSSPSHHFITLWITVHSFRVWPLHSLIIPHPPVGLLKWASQHRGNKWKVNVLCSFTFSLAVY